MESKTTDMNHYKILLENTITMLYENDPHYYKYQSLQDPEFICKICNDTGMSEDEYKDIMGLN